MITIIPIGLALYSKSEDDTTVLLAKHGHHDSLYDAYLQGLPDEQRLNMPQVYDSGVDAFGFFNKTDTDPGVYLMDRGDSGDLSVKRELAARALFVALKSHAYIILPANSVMQPIKIQQNQLDSAIIQITR